MLTFIGQVGIIICVFKDKKIQAQGSCYLPGVASKGRNALKPSFASEIKHLAHTLLPPPSSSFLQALPILCPRTGQVFFLNIFIPQCYHWKPSSTLQNEYEDSRWQCTGKGGGKDRREVGEGDTGREQACV